MVLESLAAVGLAGNIVQFITFACDLFSTTASIYRSHGNSALGFQDIENVTRNLQERCKNISSPPMPEDPQYALQCHQSLLDLAGNCEMAANDLLSAVQRLKAKRSNSKWSSFKAALATIWKESKINEMERRLDSYRQQLIFELALLQKYFTHFLDRDITDGITVVTTARAY